MIVDGDGEAAKFRQQILNRGFDEDDLIGHFMTLPPPNDLEDQLIADGHSNKAIADQLNLSANTVAVHRANIMDALGIHKTAELIVYAIRNGLVNIS